MKKALAILMAIAMIVPAVFATGPAPEVTFGLSADAEVQVIKEYTTNTFETSGDVSTPKASFNPFGLKATKLVSNDWVNFDWAPMSIKAEGKYDAYRANGDDWSWLKVTATWKDLFGFKIDYEYVQDNKEDAADNIPTQTLDKHFGNNISATYDKDGVKFWTKYDANAILDMASVTVAGQADSFLNDFKEIGFEFTNDEVATKLVYINNPATFGATIDAATIEAKNMFGFWTVLLNNADEIGYRLSLGSDSKIEPAQFKIGKDNKIQSTTAANQAMNAKNTMKFGENLTVKATLVVPNADVSFANWLAGDNALVGAEYVLADVGTIGAGAKITQDYVAATPFPVVVTASGPTKLLAQAAADQGKVVKGSAFWVDAKLDKLLGEDKAVYVGVDAQLGYYNKTYETTNKTTAGKVAEIQVGNTTVIDLYGETKMKLSDMISFSAGALFSLGTGYDWKATHANTAWTDPTQAQKDLNFYAGYNEANALNAVYGITPFELKAQVDVKINDTVSVWVKDNFKANAGEFDAAAQPAGGKAVVGYYQKNVLGLGAKLKATEKAKLSVSTDINMFLGLPAGSDLYLTGATDAQKKAVDSSVAEWKSKNFNPFAVSVSYSYAY